MPRFKNGLARAGEVYHFCFRVNGTQYKGSTKARDRATAEQVLATKRREALLGPQDAPVPIPTLRCLIQAWQASYKSTFSQRHLEIVETFARIWINPELGDLPVNKITTQRVLDLRRKMLEAGRAPNTANIMLRTLKLLMSYAIRLGHLETKPFDVAPIKVQQKPRPTIPAETVPQFLEEASKVSSDPQVGLMLAVALLMGMRISEVTHMRWEWFDPAHKTYTVARTKGKELRTIPIPEWLWNRLAVAPKNLGEWVFPSKGGVPHGRNHLQKPLQRLCKTLGLGALSPHRLRGSFATLHAEGGTPVTDIQAMLGHKAISTSLRYIEQGLESKRRAVDSLARYLGLAL